MFEQYIIPFILSFVLAIILTKVIKKLAWKFNIVDKPGESRKIHPRPTPLLGGVAVFVSFVIILLISWALGWLNDSVLLNSQILGIIIGGLVLIIGGVLDDKYNLKPWQSLLFPVVAALIAVGFGIAVKYITNPLIAGSGPYGRALFYFNWVNLGFISFGALFSFLWIVGMIYTTKFLDGLDGLVSGIGTIGALILFSVSLFWNEPMSAMSVLCLILAGSLLGFLIFNFHPAKIFLGEGGSTFVGFMLGSLSIISGGKLATALLIMGIPILDIIWVVFRRIFSGKHFYQADRKHLHHRLLDVGLSSRQTVLLLYLLTLIFGVSSIFLQSQHKVLALGAVVLVMIVMAVGLVVVYRKKVREMGI
ncbi:MAG: MraY family glycosyltransferase [Patescibacteria group bacterium]